MNHLTLDKPDHGMRRSAWLDDNIGKTLTLRMMDMGTGKDDELH